MNKIFKYFSSIEDWNLALHIGDDEKIVIKNRKNFAKKINMSLSDFVFMNQIHGWISKIVWEKDKWIWTLKIDEDMSCDSLVTKDRWLVLSVLVADCLPVLFYDDVSWVIWVAHAWWKWTMCLVTENTILNMVKLWAKVENIVVEIWPCIWANSYEVWEEVWCHFRTDSKSEITQWKQFLDLAKQNYLDLLDLGIKKNNIKISDIDTFTDKNYFSARRDGFYKWRFWWFIYINFEKRRISSS